MGALRIMVSEPSSSWSRHGLDTHRCLAIALGSQLIALITRPADPASHRPCSSSAPSRAVVQHGISLAARCGGQRAVGVGHAVRLHEALARGQDVSALVELQGILGGVRQRVERRRAHVLGSKVVVLMLHRGRELLVLVETGRHHPSSAGLGLDWTTRQQRIGLNGGGG